jgi:plastocyanin
MRMSFIGVMIMLAGSLLVFASGCKDNSSSPTAPTTGSSSITTISMAGNTFSPSTLTVAVHTTITWNNNSSIAHTSTSDVAGKWDTGNIPAGSSKQTTFDSTGTFHYHCTYHSGMTGTITVQ